MRATLKLAATVVLAVSSVSSVSSVALAHGPHGHGAGHERAYGEPGDPAGPSREITIVMSESNGRMLFAPDVVTVRVGEQIRFRLENGGELEHEFLLGTEEEIEEHADMMRAMPDMKHDDPNARRVESKARGDLVWKFTMPGEFQFACLIPGHREAGMTGKVVVK